MGNLCVEPDDKKSLDDSRDGGLKKGNQTYNPIEREKKYYNKAVERYKDHVSQTVKENKK